MNCSILSDANLGLLKKIFHSGCFLDINVYTLVNVFCFFLQWPRISSGYWIETWPSSIWLKYTYCCHCCCCCCCCCCRCCCCCCCCETLSLFYFYFYTIFVFILQIARPIFLSYESMSGILTEFRRLDLKRIVTELLFLTEKKNIELSVLLLCKYKIWLS